jgi:hypothetical protein
MKCAVVIGDGIKQVMFAPENDNERMALKMITPEDDISMETHTGSFYEDYEHPKGYEVSLCQGGYLRAFRKDSCLMLVLKQKPKVFQSSGGPPC